MIPGTEQEHAPWDVAGLAVGQAEDCPIGE